MFKGTLELICMARNQGEPMRTLPDARAVQGKGLEGDRYAEGRGYWSDYPGGGKEVTLIECEAFEALKNEAKISLIDHCSDADQTNRSELGAGLFINSACFVCQRHEEPETWKARLRYKPVCTGFTMY